MWTYRNTVDCSYILPNFRHSFYYSSVISFSYSSLSTPSLETLDFLPNPCAQSAFDQEFLHLTTESTVFYTDGSKVDHSTYVGAAVFSPQLQAELMYKLFSYTSVFSAEAYAIYNAITISIDLHLRKVTIVTDSRSVLEAVKGTCIRTNNYLILLIRARIEEAENEGTRIQFLWVPSHRGITGNEKADQLAKRAIRHGIEPNFKVLYSDLCAVIKQQIKILETPLCPCGYPQQDILHMIFDCPDFSDGARLLRRVIDRASPSGDRLTKFARAISKPSECLGRLILNFSKSCCRHF
ncbi:Gag-Pol polyprotein [Trachymyrmex zeteki]|uniref:ribonuclease H n=1 Tax=Mycetomoellerius zeteki TaxID=64791 RepID=A0A151X378_9HYME|nr:Gag-Pol polyprotein [Trachymyrmex zeteki]